METLCTLRVTVPVVGLLLIPAMLAAAQTPEPPEKQEEVTVMKYDGEKKVVIKSDGKEVEIFGDLADDGEFYVTHPEDLWDLEYHRMLDGMPIGDVAAVTMRLLSRELGKVSSRDATTLRKMEAQSHKLAKKARSAGGEEREELEGELRDHLEAIFALKQARRLELIEMLRAALDSAVSENEDRESNREEIIERRFDELLGRSRYKW